MRPRVVILALSLCAASAVFVPAGFAQEEEPSCAGEPATISGSGVIRGTEGPDVIAGSAGDDRISRSAEMTSCAVVSETTSYRAGPETT